MDTLDQLESVAHAYFGARHAAREASLAHARLLIRHCGNAIRAVHRRDWGRAEGLLAQARDEIGAIEQGLAALPELYHHNYVGDALKEYAEARLTLALVRDEELPAPDALGVGYVPYYSGLAEAVGELRRYTLDALRRDDYATGERLLGAMDRIYELLVTIDYPDAVTGSLRRATDGVRGILEKTRGDLTTAAGQHRLEHALAAAERSRTSKVESET
jgi:translin